LQISNSHSDYSPAPINSSSKKQTSKSEIQNPVKSNTDKQTVHNFYINFQYNDYSSQSSTSSIDSITDRRTLFENLKIYFDRAIKIGIVCSLLYNASDTDQDTKKNAEPMIIINSTDNSTTINYNNPDNNWSEIKPPESSDHDQ